ncbi:monovalent cation/H(+) antiporter subunit G [Glaciibacter psychrotolerans]|uniref:Multicomponent Na+:H+ antiporter subunit G n=1 Tax=Glaciibacter psychrotolerans TaxID=670054 RepID=A0A7Z0EHE7_9MICO|nr:monovalent cation/H(+) antiporter subunit G [Leifsonia psychrotolerans]NYJ21678.1 multicomponent Na+:H+ antiporter subunit G [Leifsonia psychrotolerans]
MSDIVRDVTTAVLVLAGALLCFSAGIGLVRFPDLLTRLHAATKPQIFGLMAICADVAVNNFSVGTLTMVVAIIGFQALTAPMTAHLVARAAYDTQHLRTDLLIADEMGPRRR